MHILEYWQRANTGLTHTQRGALTEEMLVWLAIIRPLTRWADGRYGDFLDKATWMLAGPQGMKLASLRSRILWRLLCTYSGAQNQSLELPSNPRPDAAGNPDGRRTCVGSTSPWMMLRMAM